MLSPPLATRLDVHSDGCLDPQVFCFVRRRARRLARHLGCPHLDGEDVVQEVMLDLWQRWPKFDAARAKCWTFVRRVVENKLVEIVRYHRRKKRRHDVSGFSLQSPLHHTEHTEWGDLLDHDDTAGQWPQIPSSQDATERSLDVAAVLATLPIELRPLCECLARSSGAAVRRELHLTKHTFRKALVQLREHFAAAGLQQESGRIFGSPDAKRRM